MSAVYTAAFMSPKEEIKDILIYAASHSILLSVSFFFFGLNIFLGMKWSSEGTGDFISALTSSYDFMVSFTMVTVLIIYAQDFGRCKQAVLDSIISVQNVTSGVLKPIQKPSINGRIQFKNVYFSYPSAPQRLVLHGFNLTISPGQTVALVGSSGHGKSTIINLMEKFYFADSGKIIIDDTDIRDVDTHYLRDNMSLVTQEPLLFNMTIRENILYGAKSGSEISDETLFHCCRQANIYDFIMGMPERFNSMVGARGSQLSGGQRQRLAIARSLIRDPKILLLDEATSALDSESEKEVQDALDKAAQGRTTIVIAHRLSTVKNADVIVVVENGAVLEKGNHEELINLKGKYYNMLLK